MTATIPKSCRSRWKKEYHKWFAVDDFSSRSPGLLKIEQYIDAVIAASAKCYTTFNFVDTKSVEDFANTLKNSNLLEGSSLSDCIRDDVNLESKEQIKAKGVSNISDIDGKVFLETVLDLKPPPVAVNWGIRKEVRKSELSLYSLTKQSINPVNTKRVSDGPSWTKPIFIAREKTSL